MTNSLPLGLNSLLTVYTRLHLVSRVLTCKLYSVKFSTTLPPKLSKHLNYARFNAVLSSVLFSATISAFVPSIYAARYFAS